MVIPDEMTPPPVGYLLFPLIRQRSIVMVDAHPRPDTPPKVLLFDIVESRTVRCSPTTTSNGIVGNHTSFDIQSQ